MFEYDSTLEAQEGKVEITDVRKQAVEQFLDYLYTGAIPGKEKMTDDLLVLADKVWLENNDWLTDGN